MQRTGHRPISRPSLLPAARVVAGLIVVLVLVQSLMAGRSLFGTWDIEIHGYVGNGTFALGVVTFGLVWAMRPPRVVLVTAAALLVLLFAQVGLGYVGRESTGAAAWHIPTGVTIMGVAVFHLTSLTSLPRRDDG